MKKQLFTILILSAFLCYQYGLFPLSVQSPSDIRIIAHRGDSTRSAENTLPAFLSAKKSGADCIEMDIRCTKDEVPVVFHDKNLRRLTGLDCPVSEITCKDFLSLTLPAAGPDKNYSRTTPCTLEHVLQLYANHSGLCLHLDIKVAGAEEKVASLLQKYDPACSYEISSDNTEVLKNFNRLNPDVKTYLILSSAGDICNYFLSPPDDIEGISVKSHLITALLVSVAKDRNHEVYAWTVNHAFHARRLRRLRVDGIITDNPLLLRKMLS